MKSLLAPLLAVALALFCSGCARSEAAHEHAGHEHEASAATFKAGHGLQLSPVAARLVGLQIGDVAPRRFPQGEVTAVPVAALLRTVHGDFVYATNGERLLRTPVKIGATHDGWIEITDGLYEGDRLAVAGVRALWLAELQAVNGGVGCADGH